MKPVPALCVVVPFYNEADCLLACLDSLAAQTWKNFELILVDDGSTDSSAEIARAFAKRLKGRCRLIQGGHLGPGSARNRAARLARAKILVFVDADMAAAPDFLKRITAPIRLGKEDGTFVLDEMVSNPENPWSRAWSLAHGLPPERRIRSDAPMRANTYRAMLRKKFLAAGGHREERGVSEDEMDTTLVKPGLGVKGALLYHANPASFEEVWNSARWFGRGKASYLSVWKWGGMILRHNPIRSIFAAGFGALRHTSVFFFIFKLCFDFSVFYGLLEGRLTGRKVR